MNNELGSGRVPYQGIAPGFVGVTERTTVNLNQNTLFSSGDLNWKLSDNEEMSEKCF
jgi:hypothetical protein